CVLFERGAFTAADTQATAAMLSALALGLPAYVMIKVLHPSYFAREDTKTPMIYAGVAMASTAILSFVLFLAVGFTGIAIASMLSGWINVGLLIATLKRRDGFRPDQTFRRRFAAICAASAVMGAVVFALVKLLDPWFAPTSGLLAQGAALITLVGVGLLVYLGTADLLDAAKIKNIIKEILSLAPGHWRSSHPRLRCTAARGTGAMQGRPRRSVLYMPGSNERALEKAKTIPADALIFDLEDAVAPDAKPLARDQVSAAVRNGGYGGREIVIRVNALETPWGTEDILAACEAEPDAILVPQVGHPGDVISVAKILQGGHGPEKIRLWAMIETPMAILKSLAIAATAVYEENRLCCLVMGTNDLIKESRARALHDRFPIVPWLAVRPA